MNRFITLFTLFSAVFTAAIEANPTARGKKITFSPDTSIDFSKIKYTTKEYEPGTPEYYESHQLVSVSRDGTEYEGSLEEVMEIMKQVLAAQQDMAMDDPVMPTAHDPADRADPINMMNGDDPVMPTAHDPMVDEGNDGPGPEPPMRSSFKALYQAMEDNQLHTVAPEKRSVIGQDTRTKVSPPNRFPYTAIGRVQMGCTGSFVARKTVLTSGHCLYNTYTNQWYQNLNVERGKDCDPNGGTLHTWKHAITFRGWIRDHNWNYDIGIIVVNEPTPVFMQFASAPTIALEIINLAGYPGDKPGWCLWASHCTLSSVDAFRLYYQCDTAGGMSGSGVYKFWLPNTRIIYGVHGYGTGGTQYNKAVRMTSAYESAFRGAIITYNGN